MIISNLSYIETLDLQSSPISAVEGGTKPADLLKNIATAGAGATAIGEKTVTGTTTQAIAVPGGSSSGSASVAGSG